MKTTVRTLREYISDIIENNTEEKAFGCINCDIDESHIIFKEDNNTLFLNDIIEFITKHVLSPYNLAHSEIGDCCGCFTIIDEQGIIRCNECNKSIHEAMEAYHSQFEGKELPEEELRKELESFTQWLQDTYRNYGAIDSSFDGDEAFKFFVPANEDIDEYLKNR